MKFYGVTIQMKATEQYFPVVLFVMASSFWVGDGLLLDTCAHSDTIMGVFSIFSKRKLADFSLILEPHGKCR